MTNETSQPEPDWRAEGHWRDATFWETFEAAARQNPAAWIRDEVESLSLAQLLDRALRIAGGLRKGGVRSGDAVIVQSRNSIDAYAALLACFARGFVAIPLPPMFSAAQVSAVADSSAARALLALDEDCAERAEEVLAASPGILAAFAGPRAGAADGPPTLRPWRDCLQGEAIAPEPPHPDSDAMVLYSSGSTGSPKGVVHCGNSLRFAVEALARLHRVGSDDRVLVALEFGFVGGTVLGAILALAAGASCVLMRRWDAGLCLDRIERDRITYTLLMPTHCYDVVNHPDLRRRDCSSLTRAIMAGATPEQRRFATGLFCGTPLPMYGMSESIAHCTCAVGDAEADRNETDGRPLPGTQMRVLDDSGAPVAPGEIGNVFLRGPNRLRRYQARPDMTASVLLDGGWFRTGDRGRLGERGTLTFVARASELIRRGGVMIQPAEVELALRDHPAITEVAVVGIPDERLGERACACVTLAAGRQITLEDVKRHLAARGLARYQMPEHLLVLEQFPRTPSLKVKRSDLATLAASRLAP